MEQSVVVSSSHIVRQGTFATDPSKTLRSKSGAIKKGTISLPVIDDESTEIRSIESQGTFNELQKKRTKVSKERKPVGSSDLKGLQSSESGKHDKTSGQHKENKNDLISEKDVKKSTHFIKNTNKEEEDIQTTGKAKATQETVINKKDNSTRENNTIKNFNKSNNKPQQQNSTVKTSSDSDSKQTGGNSVVKNLNESENNSKQENNIVKKSSKSEYNTKQDNIVVKKTNESDRKHAQENSAVTKSRKGENNTTQENKKVKNPNENNGKLSQEKSPVTKASRDKNNVKQDESTVKKINVEDNGSVEVPNVRDGAISKPNSKVKEPERHRKASVSKQNVEGNTSTGNSVSKQNVEGNTSTGNSVSKQNVEGNTSTGNSVSKQTVEGNTSTGNSVSKQSVRGGKKELTVEKTAKSDETHNSVKNSGANINGSHVPDIKGHQQKVVGHIEASESAETSTNIRHSDSLQKRDRKSRVKSEEKVQNEELKEQNLRKLESPLSDAKTLNITESVHEKDLTQVYGVGNESHVENTEKRAQKGNTKVKRFSKASDAHDDLKRTDSKKQDSELSPTKSAKEVTQHSDTAKVHLPLENQLDSSVSDSKNTSAPSGEVETFLSKPPQSTTLLAKTSKGTTSIEGEGTPENNVSLHKTDPKSVLPTHNSSARNKPIETSTKDSKASNSSVSAKMDSFTEHETNESYESVYAERKTLLEAEVTYRKRIKQLEDEMNQFLKTIEDLRSENKTIRNTVDHLESENKRSNFASQQSANTVVINTEQDDLKMEIKYLKQENRSLNGKIQESYDKNKEMTSQNQRLESEIAILRDRLSEFESRPSSKKKESKKDSNNEQQLMEKLAVTESQLTQSKSTEESLRKDIDTLKSTEQNAKKETEKLQSENKRLQYELEKFKEAAKEDAELSKDGSVTARDKMELKSHVVSLQTDNQSLNEENMKLKAECLDHVRKIHELEKKVKSSEKTESEKMDIQTLKRENEELKTELKKVTDVNSTGSAGKVKQLETENKALSNALSQKKMELDELMHALNGDRIEDEVQKVKKEKEELQKKLEESEKKVEVSEQAVKELEVLKVEKETLQEKLQHSDKKMEESEKSQEEIRELKMEKEKLQKQLEENEKRVLESSESFITIQTLTTDKETIQRQLEERNSRVSVLNKSLEEVKINKDLLETEKQKVSDELAVSLQAKEKLQSELDQVRSSKDKIERELDEERSKHTILAEKEWELGEATRKSEQLEKELLRTKKQHTYEMDKIKDETWKEEDKLRKDLENIKERKNETIDKLNKRLQTMESTKDIEIQKLKEQIETLVVDQEMLEKSKDMERENKELRQELKTVYNKYSQMTIDLEQKNTIEQKAFEMSMRVEQMSVKMKLMEKDEKAWMVQKERFDEIEASNKRLLEENVTLKKTLESKGDVTHRINYLERRQTDSDTRVKQLEGWVGDLYDESSINPSGKSKNKRVDKNGKNQNSNTQHVNPAKKPHSLDDVDVQVDDKMTESSTPTLPSIYAGSDGRVTFRSNGYSQIHKKRIQIASKHRR